MSAAESQLRTLRQLAEDAGLPPRTIRFYIARGLLPGPRGAGRGAAYGDEHLEWLREIRRLQQQGLTLSAIAGALHGGREAELPQPAVWNSYQLQDDVVVWVRGDAGAWRIRQIRTALTEFAERLRMLEEGDHHAETGD